MLLEEMTKDKAFKEMTEDIEEMLHRMNGWRTKYGKKLKNKSLQSNTVIDTLFTTSKNYNEMIIILAKESSPNGKIADLVMIPLFRMGARFVEPLNINNSIGVSQAIIYTDHFCYRLRERTGMGFIDARKEIVRRGDFVSSMENYTAWSEQGLPEGEWYATSFITNLALAKPHRWGYVMTTVINSKQGSAKQIQQIVDSKRAKDEMNEMLYQDNMEMLRRSKICYRR